MPAHVNTAYKRTVYAGVTYSLDRRRLLTSAARLAASFVLGRSLRAFAFSSENACALTPELETGPFYIPSELVRQDIRESQPGVPLRLRIRVVDVTTCKPVKGVAVDIWHCDAGGVYSGYTSSKPDGFGGPSPTEGRPDHGPGEPPAIQPTDKETFLRGIQLTDADGLVEFQTIYPGWYVSRDTHIHTKVHVGGGVSGNTYSGGHISHTGQIAFPDEISDAIAKIAPYNQHKSRRTRLDEDHVFDGHTDSTTLLQLAPVKRASLADGMSGTITLMINPAATPSLTGPDMQPFGPPVSG